MRYVCLLVLMQSFVLAQDGAAIYKERCASCHDTPQGRVPALSTLKQMTGAEIYIALTNGTMKSRAEGLATPEIFALIGYIGPKDVTQPAPVRIEPTCKSAAVFRPGANSAEWNGWSTSATNSRFQDKAAAGLTAQDVSRLKLKWAFNLGDVTMGRGQPVIVGGECSSLRKRARYMHSMRIPAAYAGA